MLYEVITVALVARVDEPTVGRVAARVTPIDAGCRGSVQVTGELIDSGAVAIIGPMTSAMAMVMQPLV